jgi:site-specific recombinase XerD
MAMTDAILNWQRFLKRRNCSPHAVKNYLNLIKHFILWLDVPVEAVTHVTVSRYIEHLMRKRLAPKTVNCHLNGIRQFYHYLREEEGVMITNPIKKTHRQKMSQPLPRHLRDDQVETFFKAIKGLRDRAMFMLMLRCGLRVEEVAQLTIGVIDVKRRTILVEDGKGGKDRVVYLSHDALQALAAYLRVRPASRSRKIFLAEKKPCQGQPISIRGIQRCMETYARQVKLKVSCHHLRHTMATQLLNADAGLATIQDLLGHGQITTTQRYCRVSNLKVQRDYYHAIQVVLDRSQAIELQDS